MQYAKNSNLFPKKMKFIQIFFFLYFLFSYNHAYAYIDPGTGGILLQALLGLVAAVGAYITLYWRKFNSMASSKSSFRVGTAKHGKTASRGHGFCA